MRAQLLDDLLEKLNRGEAGAAEQVFRAYEPYLRMIVRRQLSEQLRSKFDSVDVVQSVWTDVLQGLRDGHWEFMTADRLKGFLVTMTRNRFLDRVRQHQRAVRLEQPLPEDESSLLPSGQDPRPSEVASAEELWEQMLALCPPAHHELLRLKRQGVPLAEIAARTGLHESSVRRILYDLARRLAARRGTDLPPDDIR